MGFVVAAVMAMVDHRESDGHGNESDAEVAAGEFSDDPKPPKGVAGHGSGV